MEDTDYFLEVESGTCGVQPVRILEMVANKGTVVIVPHSFGMLKSVCERIVSLENGFIKEVGEPEQIIEVYHGRVEPSPNSSSEEKE
jgi:teichoic acid transport system ATP-binding protein